MDRVPDEILEIIFQYLTSAEQMVVCTRVCQRWQYIIERYALAVRRSGDEQRLHVCTRTVLLTAYPVDLSCVLRAIDARAICLRELSVHEAAPFHPAHFAALHNLPHLTHLDVFTRSRLLDRHLAPLALRLTTLVLNESVAPGLLSELTASARLTSLHMYGRALHYPRRDLLALLAARAQHLHALTLRCTELPDAAYGAIGACGALRELRLYSCWRLTAAGARALTLPRHLRVLHVSGARLVRPRALADMLYRVPATLRELALSTCWFSDEHVSIVSSSAPHLRHVELWRCKLTVCGARALANSLTQLTQLDLDLTLSHRHLLSLSHHTTLQLVRCVPEEQSQSVTWVVNGLRVMSTLATYADKYFRPGGEGFRSTLFYYWTRDILLEPLQLYNLPDS